MLFCWLVPFYVLVRLMVSLVKSYFEKQWSKSEVESLRLELQYQNGLRNFCISYPCSDFWPKEKLQVQFKELSGLKVIQIKFGYELKFKQGLLRRIYNLIM